MSLGEEHNNTNKYVLAGLNLVNRHNNTNNYVYIF